MHFKSIVPLLLAGPFFSVAAPLHASVKMGSIFSNNMVLQRDMKVPLWGTADPGEEVTVSLLGQKQTATAGKDGNWMVKFDPLKATSQPFEITIAGTDTLTIKNVLVGDVWFCGGQSNMARRAGVLTAAKDPSGDFPQVRDYQARSTRELTPQKNVPGLWTVCTPQKAEYFSGAGFFFARDIHRKIGVPIGIVESCVGATSIEAWMNHDALSSRPEIKPFLEAWDKGVAEFPAMEAKFQADIVAWGAKHPDEKAKFEAAMDAWVTAKAQALATRQPLPPAPANPPNAPLKLNMYMQHHYEAGYDPVAKHYFLRLHSAIATGFFNGMIAPLIPYAIRGVLWYQGENNTTRADLYRFEFPALIESWRKEWGQGDFPFLFVQLAKYQPPQVDPVQNHSWAELRESQMLTSLAVPNTAMASAIDLGKEKDIHASDKEEIGHRLAACGLALSYGMKLEYEGPIYDSMAIEGDKVRLRFTHTGSGLTVKGDKLTGFAIAGQDRKFVWADAAIDGDTVLVSSATIPQPKFVYYAWGTNPPVSLYNKEGFPASSFRTDEPAAPFLK